MNELVFIQNDEAVTDSLTVAEVFEKRHDSVLRDITKLHCTTEFHLHNFVEVDYVDESNRTYRKILIKKDGLSFLVFGYTGKKAAEYKEKYIKAFNEMEKKLNEPHALSQRDQLIAAMKLSIESNERMDGVEKEVGELKERFDNELTLTHGQATALNHAIKKRIEQLYHSGFMGSLETKRQMYSHIHSQLRRAFQSPTYREVKRTDFEESIKWVEAWRPL